MDDIHKVLKSIRITEDQILEISFLDDVLVYKGKVQTIYETIDLMTQGQRLHKLIIIGKQTQITKEARFLIVENNAVRKQNIIAEAIIVHSFYQKLSANFYIYFIHHYYPIQFFTDIEKGKDWLMQLA